MSATPYIIIVAAALVAGGCFNPDLSSVKFKCDAEHACPDGMVCDGSLCVSPTPTDGSSSDQSMSIDMDAAMMSGCADGAGFPVGSAFACPGTFVETQGTKRCAAGWTPCTSGLMVDLVACNKLNGFFIGRAPAAYLVPNRAMPICGTVAMGGNPLWFGCGDALAAKPYVATHTSSFYCSDFTKSLDCANASWNCTASYDLNRTTNTVGSDGVLCCRQ